jgi:4-amino-4-deoxy-L-arabinose transferase-like glycosyltransferase
MVFRAQDRAVKVAFAIGIVAFALRLIGLNQPFVDDWSWRQSDVASIARNFHANGFHFAYPQIDWAGNEPGYVGTEFPILPFMAAEIYRFAGIHAWIGRSQAVLLFALSLPFFFLLVRKLFDSTTACWALIFYSFAPLQIMASRCFMPDVPSLSLSIVGLYLFLRWTEEGARADAEIQRLEIERHPHLNPLPSGEEGDTAVARTWRADWFLFGSALAISLAILIKIPTALIGVPLAVLAFERFGLSVFRRGHLWLFGVAVLLPSAVWYWHAHQIAEQFYPYHFFGAGGFEIKSLAWYLKIARFTLFSSFTVLFSAVAVAGLLIGRRQAGRRPFLWWGVTLIGFVIAAGYGNRHPWYQLPLVPIAAAFAGNFCSTIANRFGSARLLMRSSGMALLIVFGVLSFFSTRFFYRENAAKLRELGLQIKASTPPGSLIVVPDYGDPAVFYYAERKGWHFLEKSAVYDGHPIDSAMAAADLENLRARGATHIVFYTDTFWWLVHYKEFAQELDQTCAVVINTPQCRIYRLPPKAP